MVSHQVKFALDWAVLQVYKVKPLDPQDRCQVSQLDAFIFANILILTLPGDAAHQSGLCEWVDGSNVLDSFWITLEIWFTRRSDRGLVYIQEVS